MLAASLIPFLVSVYFWFLTTGNEMEAIFVGIWVPSILKFCYITSGNKEMSTEVIISGAFIVVAILFIGAIFTVLEMGKTVKEEEKRELKNKVNYSHYYGC